MPLDQDPSEPSLSPDPSDPLAPLGPSDSLAPLGPSEVSERLDPSDPSATGDPGDAIGGELIHVPGAIASAALTVQTARGPVTYTPDELVRLRQDIQQLLLEHEFGLREIETKLAVLREEFLHLHDYNPIEHVTSRVKTAESLLAKATRKGLLPDMDRVRAEITDIAGARVTCSFVEDTYRMFDLLTQQDDVTLVHVKDYIAQPKPNGYKSLHAILRVPVFLSTGKLSVTIEVQFRTIAMDFWASLEHKIYYKYDAQVPDRILGELHDAAVTAAELDSRMERLHRELHGPVV